MHLLNFSHPLTSTQVSQVEAHIGYKISTVIDIPVSFDLDLPFTDQVTNLINELPLSKEQLQTEPIIINLPALNHITAVLIANLHGCMGYFPPIIRLHLVPGSLPPRYEVAEIINLQAVRDQARKSRYSNRNNPET